MESDCEDNGRGIHWSSQRSFPSASGVGTRLGNRDGKTLSNFKLPIRLANITSRDAERACFSEKKKLEKGMAVSGSVRGFPRKTPEKFRKNCWKHFSQIMKCKNSRIQAPGKANLPRTLGRHCLDLVPTFRAGCFFEIDSSSLLEFF